MLKIIEGRAGAGKTAYIFDEIKRLVESGDKNVVLMVPEQFTAVTERALVLHLGNKSAEGIEVLSFNRISDYIFKKLGGIAARHISVSGRYIVMNRALDSVRENLRLYKNSADYIQFIESLISVSDEFASYCITAEAVEKALCGTEGILSDKMHDLILIFEAYNAILGQDMLDGSQDLKLAAEKLENSTLFDGYTFYFDSYSGFTPNQAEFIDVLLPRLKNAVFALTGSGLSGKNYQPHFEISAKTCRVLKRIADKNGIGFEVIKAEGKAAFCDDISHLEQNLFSAVPYSAPLKTGGVAAACASSTEDEVSFVAGDILKKCRENGYSFKDFAVIAHNAEDYDSTVSRVFAKYKVPVFVSVKEDLINTPLASLILSAIRCITSGFTYQSVFGYLKSNLSPLDDAAVCELEAYAYTWNIRGSKWTSEKDWTNHPDGYNRVHTEKTEEKLARINKNRKIAISEIIALKEKTKKAGAADISRAIYGFLQALSVKEKLEAESKKLEENGDFDGAAKTAQLWNTVMLCLDQLALLGGESVTLARYAELLKMALSAESVAAIPTLNDAVTFGAADRIRTKDIKVSYILGMNEGVFPKSSFEQGIITDKEREYLLSAGVELAATAEKKADEERFLCYCALTSASDCVTVSYSSGGIDGKHTKSSFVYKSLFNMFDGLEEIKCADETLKITESKDAAFEYLLLTKGQNLPLTAVLEKYFTDSPEYSDRLEKIYAATDRISRTKTLENKCNVKELYSGKTLSPTRIDSFAGCKFCHFCRYGLSLSGLERTQFSSLEIGTFMHSIVENFFKNHYDSPREKQNEILSGLIADYVAENQKEFDDATDRFKTAFGRLKRVLNVYITNIREELALSDFKPIAFELKIGMGGNISPYRLKNYEIGGKIDRVDGYKKDGKLYVRVVDYKTGSKDFAFEEVASCMGLQMLLYLFALCQNGQSRFGSEILPAGVLYSPIKAEAQRTRRGKSQEEMVKKAHGQNIAKGILLNDEEILGAMDRSGKFELLPVKFKNGKPDERSAKNLLTDKQFAILENYVKDRLEKTISEMENGETEIAPVEPRAGAPCRYCEMNAICGFDDENGAHKLEKMDKDEFFAVAGGAEDGN